MGQERWEVLEYLQSFGLDTDEIAYVNYYDLNGQPKEGDLSMFLDACTGLAPETIMDLFEYVVTYVGEVIWREE